MEEIYLLKRPESSKDRKRVGRGTSSGHGKTSCRGQKGQMSRSGSKHYASFEGGQMPFQRRLPKRGFNNPTKISYQIVNLSDFAEISGPEITPDILTQNRIIKNPKKLVKVLGKGELKKGVKVIADAFSESAKKGIESAGGQAVLRTAAS